MDFSNLVCYIVCEAFLKRSKSLQECRKHFSITKFTSRIKLQKKGAETMFKHFTALMAIAAIFAITGCESVPIDVDTSVPPADSDPSGFRSMSSDPYALNQFPGDGGNGGSGWTAPENLDDSKNGGTDADGWRAVDPENRLGMPIIYFAYDSDVLVGSETANLDKIAEYLQLNPTLGLVIEGHCDSRGTDEYNRALSERRANAIREYLVSKGVADTRLKTVPCGKDKPAVPGSGEAIWSQNRRGVPIPMEMPGN